MNEKSSLCKITTNLFFLPAAAVMVNDARQADILRQAMVLLDQTHMTLMSGMSEDFVVIDLRSAWEKLGEITGETLDEDIIDEIFSRFCIGK